MKTELSLNVITEDNTHDIIKEIEDAFYDIPFENSKFQTEAFVIASQITPERAYRSIGLRMHSKLRALTEAKIQRMRQQIDLDEIEHKINSGTLSSFDLRREELNKLEIQSGMNWTNKLINDAICELNVLYSHFKKLPRYTREQFEQGEKLHFEQKLNRSVLGLDGAKESLINMNDDINAIENYEQQYLALENGTSETLRDLARALPNLLKENK